MNKSSLAKELGKFKQYIKSLQKDPSKTNTIFKKIVASYTITGMIEVINSLMSTGAYNINNESLDELFDAIDSARTVAIHYRQSNNLAVMYQKANDILDIDYDGIKNILAEKIDTLEISDTKPYLHLYNNDKISIDYDDSIYADCFKYYNKVTKQEIYIPKSELVAIENRQTGDVSYLVKLSDDKTCYCKLDPNKPSTILSTNELKNENIFSLSIEAKEKLYKLDEKINRIIKKINIDKYNNFLISYDYNNKSIRQSAYNLLNDFEKNHIIDEKIALTNKFNIKPYNNKNLKFDTSMIPNIPIQNILKEASFKDFFFIEYFLKEVKGYFDSIQEAKKEGIIIDDYNRLAQLLKIYKISSKNFSEKFTNYNFELSKLYHSYRDLRNILAHIPLDSDKRHELIDTFQDYSETLSIILTPIYATYTNNKFKKPLNGLKYGKECDDGGIIFTSKTNTYDVYKHTGETLMIGNTKYLRLFNSDPNNLYIPIKGVVYSYNYQIANDCLSSYKCLASSNTGIVQISDGGIISKYNKKDCKCNCGKINYDNNLFTLLKAYDYLKSFPQSDNKFRTVDCCPVITYHSLAGASFSESLKNSINRIYHEKFIPRLLVGAKKCKIYPNTEKPIEILNEDDEIIATIYYGNLKDNSVTQVLKNGEEIEVNSGAVLPRFVDTSNMITTIKLERNK